MGTLFSTSPSTDVKSYSSGTLNRDSDADEGAGTPTSGGCAVLLLAAGSCVHDSDTPSNAISVRATRRCMGYGSNFKDILIVSRKWIVRSRHSPLDSATAVPPRRARILRWRSA